MAQFTFSEIQKLTQVRAKYELATNEYLHNVDNANFNFVRKQYFDGNTNDALLFNTGKGVFCSVSNTIAAFTGSPVGEIDIDLIKQTRDIAATGYTVMALTRQDNDYRTEYVPPYQYIKRNDEEIVLRFYQDSQDQTVRYFMLVQTFTIGRITNNLYVIDNLETASIASSGKWVALDSIPETANLEDTVITGLDRSALFVVSEEEDIDNNFSVIQKILNLGYSMDRKLVMMDTQFLMNVESYILMKNVKLGRRTTEKAEKHGLEKKDLRGRVILGDSESDVQFVNNTNALIGEARIHIEDQLRSISAMTTVPMDFLNGDAAHGAIGAGSRNALHSAFMKTIESYRKLYKPVLDEMYETAGIEDGYTWADTFALPASQVVETVSKAIGAGIMSQHTGIMKLQELDGDQLEEEIERITNDRILVVNSQINESGNTNMNENDQNGGGEVQNAGQ